MTGSTPPYRYETVAPCRILRPLDDTEVNMERLNRLGRGAGKTAAIALVAGPVDEGALRSAMDRVQTRHEMMRVRVVADADTGELGFAPAEVHGHVPPVPVRVLAPGDGTWFWRQAVERELNAGAFDVTAGRLFELCLVRRRDDPSARQAAVVLCGHHGFSDAVSLVTIMDELLRCLAGQDPGPPLSLAAVASPAAEASDAAAGGSADEAAAAIAAVVEGAARTVAGWEAAGGAPDGARLDEVTAALEAGEADLLSRLEGGTDRQRWRSALQQLHEVLARCVRMRMRMRPVVFEPDSRAPAEATTTGLVVRDIDPATGGALRAAARAHGVSSYVALSAALSFALAQRRWRQLGERPRSVSVAVGTPIDMRRQFHPPLRPCDLRMAVDLLQTPVDVSPDVRFWEVADHIGRSVATESSRGRALSAWFNTVRRQADAPPVSAPLPLLSSVWGVDLDRRYGSLAVTSLAVAMATHQMFQLGCLTSRTGDHITLCFYHELPTVSRDSVEAIADAMCASLALAAVSDPRCDEVAGAAVPAVDGAGAGGAGAGGADAGGRS